MSPSDHRRALEPVIDALEQLEVFHFIGGSVASSAHGIARTTIDADVIADLQTHHADLCARILQDDYYVDADAIRRAVMARSSFNVIHLATMYKVDVYAIRGRPFDREQSKRIVTGPLFADTSRTFPMASAEDTILCKLEWYRMGDGVADRQWTDVVNVMKVQRDNLDRGYLRRWAVELGVADLLDEAWREADALGA